MPGTVSSGYDTSYENNACLDHSLKFLSLSFCEGQCYPCVLEAKKTCRCGATFITVLCGRERHIKPPKCKQQCSIPPSCHHPHRQPHHCHFGDCPPCSWACGKPLTCGHSCIVRCHAESRPLKQVCRMPYDNCFVLRFGFM